MYLYHGRLLGICWMYSQHLQYPDNSGYWIANLACNRKFDIRTTNLECFVMNKIFFMTIFFINRFSLVIIRWPDKYVRISGHDLITKQLWCNQRFNIQTTKLDHFIIKKIFFMTLFFMKLSSLEIIWYPDYNIGIFRISGVRILDVDCTIVNKLLFWKLRLCGGGGGWLTDYINIFKIL
jgi:hypothetical protein